MANVSDARDMEIPMAAGETAAEHPEEGNVMKAKNRPLRGLIHLIPFGPQKIGDALNMGMLNLDTSVSIQKSTFKA